MVRGRALWVAMAGITMAGCGLHMTTTEIARPYPPLPSSAPVAVMSVGIPQCPFEELQLVTVFETLDVFGDDMLLAMKDEARRVGGHALVGLREVYVDDDDDRGLTATVVRYLEPDCMS
ncbi:MAG: hypothetical protein AAF389_08050 [Gemmatimonadota bacterium]